jgi:hypothetical protein
MTYSSTNRTITITQPGGLQVWVGGTLYTLASPYTSVAHGTANGLWYLSMTSGGTVAWSQSVWNLYTDAPLALVYWDAAGAKGFATYELHNATRDPSFHANHHLTVGSVIQSGQFPAISGYTLGAQGDVNTVVALGNGVITDEDIFVALASIATGGPYTMFWVGGTSGAPLTQWTSVNAVPYVFSGTTIQYNQLTGGNWVLTNLANSQYMNVWVCAIPGVQGQFQYIFVVGQSTFANLAAATADVITNLNWAGLPFAEIAPVYQLTFQFRTANSGSGRATLESVIQLSGQKSSISSGGIPSATLGGDLGGTTSNGYVNVVRGASATMAYGGDGKLSQVSTPFGTKAFTYNGDGTLASFTGTGNYHSKTFGYTGAGVLASVTVS